MKKLFLALAVTCAVFAADQSRPLLAQNGGYETFYEDLSPEGTWFETDDYGFVWRPNVAEREDWRPYVDGNWAHTDRGWTWVSNEPFGWATYHYGRWTELNDVGWVWVPGNEWAPAWVSWRRDNDYIGWAPLPPKSRQLDVQVSYELDGGTVIRDYDIGPGYYNFIPADRFGATSYREIVLRRDDNIRIIERTTNITYIRVVNRVVFNFGPDYEEIRIRSREPVRRLTLVEVDRRDRFSGREFRRVEGNNLEIFAPRVVRTEGARPSKVERRLERAEQRNGWEIVKDESTRTRLRQKVEEEAKDPEKTKQRQTAKEKADKESAQDVAKAKDRKNDRNEKQADSADAAQKDKALTDAEQKDRQEKDQADKPKADREETDRTADKKEREIKDPATAAATPDAAPDKAKRDKDKEDNAAARSNAEKKAENKDRKQNEQAREDAGSKRQQPAEDPVAAGNRDKQKAERQAARQAERQAERNKADSAPREPKVKPEQAQAPTSQTPEQAQPKQQKPAAESAPAAPPERKEAPKQQGNSGGQKGGKNQQQAQPAPSQGEAGDDGEGKGSKKKNQD